MVYLNCSAMLETGRSLSQTKGKTSVFVCLRRVVFHLKRSFNHTTNGVASCVFAFLYAFLKADLGGFIHLPQKNVRVLRIPKRYFILFVCFFVLLSMKFVRASICTQHSKAFFTSLIRLNEEFCVTYLWCVLCAAIVRFVFSRLHNEVLAQLLQALVFQFNFVQLQCAGRERGKQWMRN